MVGIRDLFGRSKPKSVRDTLQEDPVFQEQKQLFDLMQIMCQDGIESDEFPNGRGKFGLSVDSPVPCNTIFGSTAYLARLRAPDGTKVVYERMGSFVCSLSPHPIDGYRIAHRNGQALGTVYISPYQKRNSRKAPQGFSLAAEVVA